jgi:hypothetical protein
MDPNDNDVFSNKVKLLEHDGCGVHFNRCEPVYIPVKFSKVKSRISTRFNLEGEAQHGRNHRTNFYRIN